MQYIFMPYLHYSLSRLKSFCGIYCIIQSNACIVELLLVASVKAIAGISFWLFICSISIVYDSSDDSFAYPYCMWVYALLNSNVEQYLFFCVFWIHLWRISKEGAQRKWYTALSEVDIFLGSLDLCHLVSCSGFVHEDNYKRLFWDV